MPMLDDDKAIYDDKACELIVSRNIVKNSLSSRLQSYLKKTFDIGLDVYPNTKINVVAFVVSFGSNKNRDGRMERITIGINQTLL